MLKHLDLFSGIGGFSLAGKWVGGIETTQFVEIDPWCGSLRNQNFKGIQAHDDIATFSGYPGQFDLITAGFPCQDLSAAGSQEGIREGTRSGLFFEVIRIIRECRPTYVLLENVAALLTSNKGRDMGTVLWELSQVGYDAAWQTISANALGASHTRDRLWIMAYPHSIGYELSEWERRGEAQEWGILHQNNEGQELRQTHKRPELSKTPRPRDIASVPRANDGIPGGVDVAQRLKALGNSIVPQVAEIPLRRIIQIHKSLKTQQKCNL